MKATKPPIGVMPAYLWWEAHPEPSLTELLERYDDVCGAIRRYREAGLPIDARWSEEAGLANWRLNGRHWIA
jgi:hypothetical protein